MVDHLQVLSSESARFLEALSAADPDADVPTCPGWSTADLAWHLAEVQWFWSEVVESRCDDPRHEVEPPERPGTYRGLLALVGRASQRLVSVLEKEPDDAPCWSWHDDGGNVGWVARRQAHEVLIHRVDAERCAGVPVREPEPDVARDGVDEVVGVMITGSPAWGTFAPDGDRLSLATRDAPGQWRLAFGRFSGTSPDSGRTYDLDAARLDGEADPTDPRADTARLTGRAWDLDLWLWGRSSTAAFEVHGAGRLVERLRLLAADATR